jgi:hypothetical protein
VSVWSLTGPVREEHLWRTEGAAGAPPLRRIAPLAMVVRIGYAFACWRVDRTWGPPMSDAPKTGGAVQPLPVQFGWSRIAVRLGCVEQTVERKLCSVRGLWSAEATA